MARSKQTIPNDDGVDMYESIHLNSIPEYVPWLHRQAKLGFANQVTKHEAGFRIGPGDIQVMPDLEDILGVVLGYSHD